MVCRYLLHPKKADDGMKLSWIRPVNYGKILRESSAAAAHSEGSAGDGKATPVVIFGWEIQLKFPM